MIKEYLGVCVGALFVFAGSAYAGVTVQQAIREGCYTSGQTKELITQGENSTPMGTVTLEKAKMHLESVRDRSVTRTKVTAPETWVYRSYTDASNWHTEELLEGVIYSKGQNARDKAVRKGKSEKSFWGKNGPQLRHETSSVGDLPGDPTYFMMRLLAIKTSDTPPSQYVSFALNYEVASRYGAVVYALQVNPDSPVLGVEDCTLKGEYQVQILGGTTFGVLYKKKQGQSWERYDRSNRVWRPVDSGTVPE